MKKITFVILHLILFNFGYSQIDQEFWFAAPEITSQHADSPVLLHLSAFEEKTSVTINIPANNLVTPLLIELEPNETRSINIIEELFALDFIENTVPNEITDKGLYIKSDRQISAYYEVLGTSNWGIGDLVVNTDIFTLKGNNSLGKEFYTPFQSEFNNYPYNSDPDSWSSIDIVATENNTTVTFNPTSEIYHEAENIPAGTEITISLNKGQTYSIRNASQLAEKSLSGTHIVSDKNIAVTIKDDSVFDGSWDLIGDQLIPVKLLSTDHIVGEGHLYIVATKDHTIITINDEKRDTINTGETYSETIHFPSYISTSQPSYNFQVKSIGTEFGGAIIPTISCTGSKRVYFSRATDEDFSIEIIFKEGGEDAFTLNNEALNIEDFVEIPTSNPAKGIWKYTKIYFSSSELASNTTHTIENSKTSFHLGVINGSPSTGARYGFFSNFGNLELGVDQSLCEGDTLVLDAGFGRESYKWSTGANEQTITISQSGEYYVTVQEDACEAEDTIKVTFNPDIEIDLGPNQNFCEGTTLTLTAPDDATNYHWQDGSTEKQFIVEETADIELIASNQYGCSDTAIAKHTKILLPIIEQEEEVSVCENSNYSVSLTEGYDTYRWYQDELLIDQDIDNFNFTEEGQYKIYVDNYCGADSTSMNLQFWNIQIPNIITPNGDGKNDQLVVTGIEKGTWDLTIYNRWGKPVYQNTNFNNNWISTLEDGTYYYYLTQEDECNDFRGWLYILK